MDVRGGPISRVLSRTTIYLLRASPPASIAQPERGAGRTMALLFAFSPDGACQAALLPGRWWSLTPPFQLFPLRCGEPPRRWESSFLRHFPSGHPAWPLASILPSGARTFLTYALPEGKRESRDRLAHFARCHCSTRAATRSEMSGIAISPATASAYKTAPLLHHYRTISEDFADNRSVVMLERTPIKANRPTTPRNPLPTPCCQPPVNIW